MKNTLLFSVAVVALASCNAPELPTSKENASTEAAEISLFMDVHDLEPGKVVFDDVMAAHQKDLEVQSKYGVSMKSFWVDEAKGKVYCLATAKSANDIIQTHTEAHGMVPSSIHKVTEDIQEEIVDGKPFFLDVHRIGPGKVNAEAVAGAHKKDLDVQSKYDVNLINYWLDEETGTIFCLAQAPDSNALIQTHKEAHGLLPNAIMQVRQGN